MTARRLVTAALSMSSDVPFAPTCTPWARRRLVWMLFFLLLSVVVAAADARQPMLLVGPAIPFWWLNSRREWFISRTLMEVALADP